MIWTATTHLAEQWCASGETQGVTRAYRVVNEAEYQQIGRTGTFEQGPGGAEGKWFWDRHEDAVAWGQKNYHGGPFRMVEADVPTSAPSLKTWPHLDQAGPARYYSLDDLLKVPARQVGGH